MTATFERPFRTRGYEVDRSGSVSLPILLSYLEHLRWEWMHAPSFGLLDHLEAGHFFVVREQALLVVEPIGMREDLMVSGALERVGRSKVQVQHRIHRVSDGALVAKARVVGLWLSPDRRLVRIPDTLRAHEPVLLADSERILEAPMDEPPADARLGRVVVRPSDCDRFQHVNAAAWMRLVDDARIDLMADGFATACVLYYEREAMAGEALEVKAWMETPGTIAIVLTGQNGNVRCRSAIRFQPLSRLAPGP